VHGGLSTCALAGGASASKAGRSPTGVPEASGALPREPVQQDEVGEHRSEVANLTLESFMPLGIKELLTMQRQVGFASLIERVIKIAHD